MRTSTPTDAEKKHAKAQGRRFDDALARATMSVRSNAKLIAADKLRACIAWHAALFATGYEHVNGFVMPQKGCGDPTQEMADIANVAFHEAVNAAQRAFA